LEVREKVRENHVRRKADRMGYRVIQSHRRDPDAIDYGLFMIVDARTDCVVHDMGPLGRPNLTLADVQELLGVDGGSRSMSRSKPTEEELREAFDSVVLNDLDRFREPRAYAPRSEWGNRTPGRQGEYLSRKLARCQVAMPKAVCHALNLPVDSPYSEGAKRMQPLSHGRRIIDDLFELQAEYARR
jgi:hypothetical protein